MNTFDEWHVVETPKDCEAFCYVNSMYPMENCGYPEIYPALVKVEYDGNENTYPIYLTIKDLKYLMRRLDSKIEK